MSETPQIKFKAGRENEWISVAPASNGEFDCWLRLKLHDFGDNWEAVLHHRKYLNKQSRYSVELTAIAPEALSVEKLLEVAGAACVHLSKVDVSDIGDYGFCAYLYEAEGNNKQRLLAEAKEWAQELASPEKFAWRMDQWQRPTSKSGWDAIKGEI